MGFIVLLIVAFIAYLNRGKIKRLIRNAKKKSVAEGFGFSSDFGSESVRDKFVGLNKTIDEREPEDEW